MELLLTPLPIIMPGADKLWSLVHESYPAWNFAITPGDVRCANELDETKLQWFAPRQKTLIAADPFLFDHEGTTYIFFEQVTSRRQPEGAIACCTYDGKNFSEPQTLKLGPTNLHYSYPFIFKWNGDIFLMVENYGSGKLTLYKAERFPNQWTVVKTLFDEKVVDPTVLWYNNKLWLFYTREDEGTVHTHLYLRYADSPEGPWTEHPQNPIKIDITSARPAGGLFFMDSKLYRPAQNCMIAYGHHVVINEVTELSETSFAEKKIQLVGPLNTPPYSQGLHTINSNGKYTVLDARKICTRRRPLGNIGKIVSRAATEMLQGKKAAVTVLAGIAETLL